jgi:Clp amino terminal domain, pathogenicity island component
MFERFTESARRVIFFSRYEASQFGSPAIETEHLLLGLIREEKNLTNRFLRNSSSLENVRKEIEGRTTIREKVSTSGDLPLTNECKRILAYANEEAERLNHRHIGTEHLLLGILREEKCVAAEILHERGLRLVPIREELARSGLATEGTSIPPGCDLLLTKLGAGGFLDSMEHLGKALESWSGKEPVIAHLELRLFLETLMDAIKNRRQSDDILKPIFEGFDWHLSMSGLKSGLNKEFEDSKFRLRFHILLAELLLDRYEQE